MAGRPRACELNDLYLRQHRLHTLFNANPTSTFACGAEADAETLLVCLELKRALARRFDATSTPPAAAQAASVTVAAVPVATWPDRSFGRQYLFDLHWPSLAGVERHSAAHPATARVVDDARYQLQIELNDDPPPGLRLTVIMALYNRGSQLEQWVDALAASDNNEKDPRRTVLCVADFASTDAPVDALLARTGFETRVLRMSGRFAKTVGLNACLEQIDGEAARQLIFTTPLPRPSGGGLSRFGAHDGCDVNDVRRQPFGQDVDVTLPPDFAARVRRFARPGRQIYAPIVMYENCTWTTGECWGDGGYGLVGYGLEDAWQAGAYDAASFNFREGFEDTDFLLRLFRLPRLLVRRKERDMIHRYHPRAAWKDEENAGPNRYRPLPPVC